MLEGDTMKDLAGLAACRGVSRRFASVRGVSPMKDLAGLDWHDLGMVANQTCQVWRRVAACRVVSPMKDLADLDWHDLGMVANQTWQVWLRVAAFRVVSRRVAAFRVA